MHRAFSRFGKSDYAKYPFLKAAAKYVKIPDLEVQDLEDPQYVRILERAEERLEDAILYARVLRDAKTDQTVEIISFATAIMLVIATKDSFIKKRYALAEANQTYEDLKGEPKEKTLEFARNFGWNLTLNKPTQEIPYEFSLTFVDYLQNTTHLRDSKWKLVNRLMSKGIVYLGIDEAARLLKVEVLKHFELSLNVKDLPAFPPKIAEIAEKIKKLTLERIGETEMEGFPKEISEKAFPPCVNALYQAFTSGRHLSHVGRFTLTSFLVNIGMPSEKVIELFRGVSDFNERMTRYQVEHIAGEKGSRTRYIPPMCDTLKTHGVCANPDELCRRIHHPLNYYRRKTKINPR